MQVKKSEWEETIVALATPPGIGAIGVIRLSGPDSINIINQLFQSKNLSRQPSHSLHVGFISNRSEEHNIQEKMWWK